MAGTFVMSLDTELAWGSFDKGGFRTYRRHLERTRGEIARMLRLMERYEISATWAFVGHLFLHDCRAEYPGADPHPDVLIPEYAWYSQSWHGCDPGTDRERDPFWYGDDILAMVTGCHQPQEIGCHTFSHVIMGDPAVTADIARSQVAKCVELAAERKLMLRSFVYPRNRVAQLPVLSELGFSSYRGPEAAWYADYPRALRPLCHFADRCLAVTPPTYRGLKADEHGLVNIPGSMFLMPPDGVRRFVPGWSRVRQAVNGLRRAAETDSVFHLWFHPWNLGSSPAMMEWIEQIFEEVAALRAEKRIRVMTMGDLAAEVLADEQIGMYSRQWQPY